MKLAVTYDNEEVFQHFGHTEQFKIYNIEDNKIESSEIINTNGEGHGALSGLLSRLGVNVLICGGIGGGAREALKEAGIELYPGVCGNADKAVEDYLNETLDYNINVTCSHHHENGHHHSCGANKHGCVGNTLQ